MLDFMNGFEKDNENPYRPYRVVSVKKIDRWFFERHDHRKTHTKIYETVIRPKFGICENTFLGYRHEPDELLDLFPQPVRIEFSLWLPAMQAKYMNPAEADRFCIMLWDAFNKSFKRILREEPACRINAEKLLMSLMTCLDEKSPVRVR